MVLLEDIKDSYHNCMVLFFGLAAKNEYVSHVDSHDSLIYEFLVDVIHHCLKVVGLFIRPKSLTMGSNKPWLVWKASFHLSPSLIHMLLYPHQMSSLVKYFNLASETLLRMLGIRGRG